MNPTPTNPQNGARAGLTPDSAEVFLAWLRNRASNLRVMADDAWSNGYRMVSDRLSEQAFDVEELADDFRQEMGLVESRQPKEN